MNCPSCHTPTDTTKLKFVVFAMKQQLALCPRCCALAEAAKSELKAALQRAEDSALLELMEMVMKGVLLRSPAATLPGLGQGEAP